MSFRIRPFVPAVIISVLSVLAFAGCSGSAGSYTGPAESGALETVVVAVQSTGDTVSCVVYEGYKAGGLVCDWENLSPATGGFVSDSQGSVSTYIQQVGERTVDCVVYEGYKAGGLSCNL